MSPPNLESATADMMEDQGAFKAIRMRWHDLDLQESREERSSRLSVSNKGRSRETDRQAPPTNKTKTAHIEPRNRTKDPV